MLWFMVETDDPVKNYMRTHGNTQKITTGQVND